MMRLIWALSQGWPLTALRLGWRSHQRAYHFASPIRLWRLMRCQFPHQYKAMRPTIRGDDLWQYVTKD